MRRGGYYEKIFITSSRITWFNSFSIGLCPDLVSGLPHQFGQAGQLTNARGGVIDARVNIRVRLYDRAVGAAVVLFDEIHPDVDVNGGIYYIQEGSIQELDSALFGRDELYLSIQLDNDPELTPRKPLGLVPGAFFAEFSENVVGDITPRSVTVGGQRVINEAGQWVGEPTGLIGPAGPQGDQGPAGPAGPPGAAGGNGSPDTPAQVLGKLVQVDGADSTLDADTLDGRDSSEFVLSTADVLQRLLMG